MHASRPVRARKQKLDILQEPLSSAGPEVPLPNLSVTKGFFCAGLYAFVLGK